MRIASIVVLLALLSGERVCAQESDSDIPWRTSYFPYLTGGFHHGPGLAFRGPHFPGAGYQERVTQNPPLPRGARVPPPRSPHNFPPFPAPPPLDQPRP